MILPRKWLPRNEPITRIERLVTALANEKPLRKNTITAAHRARGTQTRRNAAAAKLVLARLGL